MQKNWYMIYVKQGSERKVSSFLKRKKIENFCPRACRQNTRGEKNNLTGERLFNSYFFLSMMESDFAQLKSLRNTVNLVYWKDKPALIKSEEISAIKEFTAIYRNIKLERSVVAPSEVINIEDNSSFSFEGNIIAIKKNSIKTYLPSLGFTMVAEISNERIAEKRVTQPENNKTNFYSIRNLKFRSMLNRQ